jgi:hypothetical protein
MKQELEYEKNSNAFRKPRIIKVEPTHKISGLTAPCLIEEDDRTTFSEENAIKSAKLRSRLSDFDVWDFKIKRK